MSVDLVTTKSASSSFKIESERERGFAKLVLSKLLEGCFVSFSGYARVPPFQRGSDC